MHAAEFLGKYALTDLRIIAGIVGVQVPSHFNKKDLISEIILIVSGKKTPYRKNNRGRPNTQNSITKKLYFDIVDELKTILDNKNFAAQTENKRINFNDCITDLKLITGSTNNKMLILALIKKLL